MTMPQQRTAARSLGADSAYGERTDDLAWLLGVLRSAADLKEAVGSDTDAYVIRAHAAQLERGRQWPGDAVRLAFPGEPCECGRPTSVCGFTCDFCTGGAEARRG